MPTKQELKEEVIKLRKLNDVRIQNLMPNNKEDYEKAIEDIVFFLSCRRYFSGKILEKKVNNAN